MKKLFAKFLIPSLILCFWTSGLAQNSFVSEQKTSRKASDRSETIPSPVADNHTHIHSEILSAHITDPLDPEVKLPDELNQLIRNKEIWGGREKHSAALLADLYTKDALVLSPSPPTWLRGEKALRFIINSTRTNKLMPTVYEVIGDAGYIAGYQKVGEGAATKYINNFHYVVKKNNAGKWQIASEVFTVDPPRVPKALTADQLIKDLDAAGIKRGVVLSVAYMFGSATRKPPEDEYAKVRAENDWIAEQVARYQDRLVGFCSFNPLKDYAIEELNRCAKNPRFKGVKLHLGNSGVDIRQNPQHVEKIRQVFRVANEKRLAIVIHFWISPAYETEGGEHARVFLNQILPEAPDITVQIAHMAGGGRSTDTAMEVFANAIVAGDRRTKNIYFDTATLTAGQTEEGLRKDAQRMRQIGLKRILYGTDMAPPHPPARQSWELFRTRVPLTAKEFRKIAGNIAPYLR